MRKIDMLGKNIINSFGFKSKTLGKVLMGKMIKMRKIII